jgi:uncharacterized OB-fold protein
MPTPRPLISATSRPFWDGLRHEQIRLQHCTACSRWIFYPRILCNHCGSSALEWRECAGHGILYSFTVAQYPVSPDFADLPPQWLALVDLDVNVRLPTTLVDVNVVEVVIGASVRPVFDHSTFEDVTLLRFRLST